MKSEHKKVLVLNADYTPIGLIDWTKAITLQFKNLINVVTFYADDYILCSNGNHFPVPAVVSLVKYKSPQRKDIPFSRKNVFLRDKLTCQYCGKRYKPKDLTYDHVTPRAKWKNLTTPTCWENIVSCCYNCNTKKSDKTLKEAGMSLIRHPKKPNPYQFVLGLAPWTHIQPEWVQYIPKHYLELLPINSN